MSDITVAELAAGLPANDPVRTWWEAAAALPNNTTTNEFLVKTLAAASNAAVTKNATLTAGSRIQGYPPATNGAIQQDTAGNLTFLRTASVQSRIAVSLDIAVSPLA